MTYMKCVQKHFWMKHLCALQGFLCALVSRPVCAHTRAQHREKNVGRGGALVESMPFDRRVVSLNPALAATKGPWASPSLTFAYGASACKLQHRVSCCGQERF